MYEIKEYLRCKVTDNLCGTDTWEIDTPCKCKNCQKWLVRSYRQLMKIEMQYEEDLLDWDSPRLIPPPSKVIHKLKCLKEEEFDKIMHYLDELELAFEAASFNDTSLSKEWEELWKIRPEYLKKRIP